MTDKEKRRSLGSYLDLVRDARRAWSLLWDKSVPLAPKIVPILAAAYVITPVDVLPDFALGLGQLDDLAVIVLALKMFVSLAEPRGRWADAGSEEQEEVFGVDKGGAVIDGTYRASEVGESSTEKASKATKRLV